VIRSRLGKVLLALISVLYPALVFFGLVYLKAPPRILSLCVAVAVALQFLAATDKKEGEKKSALRRFAAPAALAALCAAVILTNSERLLKLYPVAVGATLLFTFGVTLFRPPPMILRFALLQDPSLPDNPDFEGITRYCRTVTVVWCAFFVFNIGMALYTTFFASSFAWSLYNGLISYVLIGILFVGEIVVRHIKQRK